MTDLSNMEVRPLKWSQTGSQIIGRGILGFQREITERHDGRATIFSGMSIRTWESVEVAKRVHQREYEALVLNAFVPKVTPIREVQHSSTSSRV